MYECLFVYFPMVNISVQRYAFILYNESKSIKKYLLREK